MLAFDGTLAQPVVITMAEIAKDKRTKEMSWYCASLIRLVAISRRDQDNSRNRRATIGQRTRFRTVGISRWSLCGRSGRIQAWVSDLKIGDKSVEVMQVHE